MKKPYSYQNFGSDKFYPWFFWFPFRTWLLFFSIIIMNWISNEKRKEKKETDLHYLIDMEILDQKWCDSLHLCKEKTKKENNNKKIVKFKNIWKQNFFWKLKLKIQLMIQNRQKIRGRGRERDHFRERGKLNLGLDHPLEKPKGQERLFDFGVCSWAMPFSTTPRTTFFLISKLIALSTLAKFISSWRRFLNTKTMAWLKFLMLLKIWTQA